MFEEQRAKIEGRDKSAERKPEETDNKMYRDFLNNINRNIGKRIVEIREKHGLTPKDIIKEFGVCKGISPGCLSRWESGQRTADHIFLIWFSNRFSVDLHWLITGEIQAVKNPLVQELTENLEKAVELCRKL